MDTVSAMIVFARVVEASGFSEAARRMGLSKSAVSKQIAALEDRLGARLLNRTTRKLSLTEAGAALYERCARIAAEVEAAEEAVSHLRAAPRGRLRVNAPMSFGLLHLAPALPDFLEHYPEVTVDLTLNDRFVDVVDEGYDVAIRVARLADSSLIARRLAPARLMACAAPSYLDRHGVPVTPADLVSHQCLLYSQSPANALGEWGFVDGRGQRHDVTVSGRFKANNGDAIRILILGESGIGLLPTFLIGQDVHEGRLVRVLPEFEAVYDGGVYAIFPHSRHLSPKVRALVDFVADRFGKGPYWDALAGLTTSSAPPTSEG